MDQIQIKKIINLGRRYAYEHTSPTFLDKIEYDLYKVVSYDSKNKKAIEILAKFLYERKKYEEALIEFNKLLKIDKNKISTYYGIYKCYVMLNDFVRSYNYLVKYVEIKNSDDIKKGTEIIFNLYDFIINNKSPKEIKETEKFIMHSIKDQELLTKYKQLIEAYNLKNFEKCILLVEECEKICRNKNIYIEFLTFKQLLMKANVLSKTNMLNKSDIIYNNLDLAIKDNNFAEIIQILYCIPKIRIVREDLIYNAIYILIKNNYVDEAKQILDTFIKNKRDKIVINTLYRAIDNQIEFNQLSEKELENYQTAIEKGHNYYKEGNFEYAYYIYLAGKYTTENNIFLYYIGKMLFKLEKYDEAEEYFNQYIKVGSDKLSKAYIYLAGIYAKKGGKKYKKAIYYSKISKSLDSIFNSDYKIVGFDKRKDLEIDTLKMNLQNNPNMYTECYKIFEESSIKSNLISKTYGELCSIVEEDSQLLPIIEDIIIERNDLDKVLSFVKYYFDKCNLVKFEDYFIRVGNPFYIKYFVEDVPNINLNKMGDALIKIGHYDSIITMACIDYNNVKKYETTIIESDDLDTMIMFLLNVDKANKDRLCKVICSFNNKEINQYLLDKYGEYAFKYLDLNIYYISFIDLKSFIIKEKMLDLIEYIEKNKNSFSNYNQFIRYFQKKTYDEGEQDLINILEFFEEYIKNPFIYDAEKLESLKLKWKKKYEKVYEKTFS